MRGALAVLGQMAVAVVVAVIVAIVALAACSRPAGCRGADVDWQRGLWHWCFCPRSRS